MGVCGSANSSRGDNKSKTPPNTTKGSTSNGQTAGPISLNLHEMSDDDRKKEKERCKKLIKDGVRGIETQLRGTIT